MGFLQGRWSVCAAEALVWVATCCPNTGEQRGERIKGERRPASFCFVCVLACAEVQESLPLTTARGKTSLCGRERLTEFSSEVSLNLHAPPTSPWHQSTTTCGHPQPLSSSSTQAEEELSLDTSSACSKAQRLYFMESETRVPLISNSIYRQGTLALRLREGEGPGQRLTGSLLEPESHFSDGLANNLSIFFK